MAFFLSYSAADGAEFALRLADALEAGPPSYPVWLDQRALRLGRGLGRTDRGGATHLPWGCYSR